MFHIYRQITALRRCAPVVIAQKREQTERFPFDDGRNRSQSRQRIFCGAFGHRQVRDMPWQISDAELSALLARLDRSDALSSCTFTSAKSPSTSPAVNSRLEKSVDRFLSRR